MQGKLSLQLRDQTSLGSSSNDATIEVRKSFSDVRSWLGGPVLVLKYMPRFFDSRDKVEVTAAGSVKASDDAFIDAELTTRAPDTRVDGSATLKTRGYALSVSLDSAKSNVVSLVEMSKVVSVRGRKCLLNAGMKLLPEPMLLAKAEVLLRKDLKVTPIVSCRTSDMQCELVKLEASGFANRDKLGWKVDVLPGRGELNVELREAVSSGLWIVKGSMPVDGSLSAASVALKREIIF